MSFTPHLIPVNTGICSTITAKVKKGADPECVGRLLEEAYAAAPFVRLLGRNQPADTKNVTRTNCVDIGWAYDPRTNRVILMSARPFSPSISCADLMKRKACGFCSFLIC